MTAKILKDQNRVLALEGVRGIAAVMVVLFHVLISFFPAIYYSPSMGVQPRFGAEAAIFGSHWYALINGRFAVAIFFILSGFVLSIGFFTATNNKIAHSKNINQALKRYWRLMIPALASVMIAWAILVLGLNYNQQAYVITGSLRLHSFWSFEPSFFGALYQGTVGIFKGQDWYNQPLWTMQWEFLGSFLVFGLLALFGKSKLRFIAYAVAAIIFAHSYLLGFVIGMAIADLYAHEKIIRLKTWHAALFIIFGLSFAAINSYSDIGVSGVLLDLYDWAFLWYFIGASFIIFAVLHTPALLRMLSKKPMVSLGKNTFSMYLLHDILLLTLMSFIFVKIEPAIGYVQAFLVSFAVFIAVLVPITILFTKYVDTWAITVSRNFANKFKLKLRSQLLKPFTKTER